MRILGLDIGDKRIGIAISDELGHTAQGLMALERSTEGADSSTVLSSTLSARTEGGSLSKDINRIKEIMADYSVDRVVVGLPLRMDGTIGIQAQKVKKIAERLRAEVSQPVVYWDERLTTAAARKALISGEVRRSARRRVIDKVAASLILQSYLDSLKR